MNTFFSSFHCGDSVHYPAAFFTLQHS